jgi:hypothetical protein
VVTSIDKRREERRRRKEAGLGNATTPQARAVELVRQFIVTNVGYDAGHLMSVQAQELTILLGDAGLLSSGTQEDQGGEGDGSLRSEPSAVGASVSYDELVDWVTRLEVTVRPVNGVVTIMAESMADAFTDFLRLNGIEVSRG